MKSIKKKFKKGTAMLLAGTMMAGLMTVMPQSAIRVKAAGTAPGVSAYATKEQLMDGTFAPDSSGTPANIGKLVFGKKSDGATPQEWYILGADSGVTGGTDNTIIFATSPIATGQMFNSSTSNKTFQSSFGVYAINPPELYVGNPTEVYANHYGASDLRVALQTMATNTSCFTTAEQGLMNATTVTTKDALNKNLVNNNVYYGTTDKLYALMADGYGSSYKTIKAGTFNQTVLAMNSYWSSGERFWLRSPNVDDANYALLALPGTYVVDYYVLSSYGDRAVRPASNLNLSSVLFASAASSPSTGTVASGTITSGTAMALRLDGSSKDIGSVTYNTTTGDIKAVRGSTSQTVALVVQGNDGTNNWYYSKKIDASETINAADIKSALNLSSDIDLSVCKIWLEITNSTERMIYAVSATERTITDISSVEITGIDTPTANTALDTEASCATAGVSSTTPQIIWTPSDTTAGYNTSYTASVTLTAATGYEFTDSTIATVNGNTATGITKNGDGTLTVTYAFSATEKDKLIRIIAPQPITVANGTAYAGMNLPATVTIETEGNTVTTASVTWDTSAPVSGSYDPAVLTEQTVTLNGRVDCPADLDANGVSLTTTLTITISASGNTGAPTVTPISLVEITGIDAPTANTALDTEAVCATTEVSSTTPQITWTPNHSKAGYNTSYTASVTLTADTGYEFTDSTIATVNGNGAASVTKNQDGTLTVTYAFSATEKDKLISITAPQPITVANGTAYGGMNLPATVTIETEGNTVTTATVTWDTSAPASGSYDPTVLTEQTVTLNGTVDCPADLDANGVSLTTTLTITISAAGIVGAPTVTPAAGTYTQNQSAALVSSTEGAKLYYTTDGSEPALAGGTPTGTTMEYTAPIAVTGTQGQSVTTTIRAIAVKEGMQNSSVQTFTYTINLAMPKHTITATAGANGRISPAGMVEVTEGNDQLFTITAEEGYEIAALKVDNAEVSVMSSYTFTGVRADHTIAVTFKQKDTPVQPVEAPAITAQPQNTTVGAGETAVLTVMENTAPAPARVNYEILDGANGSWVLNSDGSLSIRGSGEFSKFVGVRVDGTLIDTTNYTAREGSTIITLEAAYLNTLSVGTHTFELIWTDGSANTTVTINANASRNSALPSGTNKKDDVPKTGDSTPMAGLFILAGLSGAGLIFTGGKGRKNPEASGE